MQEQSQQYRVSGWWEGNAVVRRRVTESLGMTKLLPDSELDGSGSAHFLVATCPACSPPWPLAPSIPRTGSAEYQERWRLGQQGERDVWIRYEERVDRV
ncbi:hypothetical protein Pcinc_034834 [Petrolisthes cinctipes]|uniref:Uncharacterized protein n=1 Tax=Petrolisthes cinctipes TaxID=88211 RepID=A0AAE1BXZ5_PETCI|nr:hypothetical protein Pcinc_034834 [Petrolisthes cinctipes]